MNKTKVPENRAYKVTLILLLGLAAFTSAMKELNRLHTMVSSVHEFTKQWSGSDLVTVNENPVAIIESCPVDSLSPINSSAESGLSGLIAAATDGYVETMDYGTTSEREVGAKVDAVVGKWGNGNVPQSARPKFAPSRRLKEEMASSRPNIKRSTRFEYEAFDRVALQIPLTMISDIKPGAFENEVSQDFVFGLISKIDRKHLRDKNENRRRELFIKRLERGISSRRAS